MAQYTITINTLLQNDFDFGLDEYPIYDEAHREELNKSILTHYLMREIGFETAELFKVYLNQKMNEIMPKYNVMYTSQLSVIGKLFDNVDINETSTTSLDREQTDSTNIATTSNSTTITDGTNKQLFQDTPQGRLKSTEFEDQDYATNLTLNKEHNNVGVTGGGTSNGSSTLNENSARAFIRHLTGNNGNKYPIELLNNIKFTIANIDEMIIKDLDELFMQIY